MTSEAMRVGQRHLRNTVMRSVNMVVKAANSSAVFDPRKLSKIKQSFIMLIVTLAGPWTCQ